MIDVNISPLQTVRNYKINSLEIDENIIPDISSAVQENFVLPNCLFKQSANINLVHKMSDVLDQNSEKSNLNYSFCIDRSGDKPAVIGFSSNENLIENIVLQVNNYVSGKAIIRLNSVDFHNGRVKFVLGESASLDCVLIVEGGKNSFLSIQTELDPNSNFDLTLIDFSSGLSAQNVYFSQVGQGSKTNLKSIYFGDGKFDLNYLSDLMGQNSVCQINCVGALFGNARKNFKGTINFVKGASHSYGDENEYCLLLSKDAQAKALPMLLCGEEDVDGKHSTAVGQVDESQMFYCMSRGLNKSEAQKLVVKAKFSKILNQLFDENIKNEVLDKIDSIFVSSENND
mgnify:CR=1 FL=1